MFSAEPQRGIRRRCGGNVEAPAAGAKRKDNLRFSFLFELLPFPCFLIRRRFPICDRFENRERQSGYLSVCFATYSQFTDRLLLHIRATLRWVRHNSAARIVSLEIVDSTCECRHLVTFIFVGAVCDNTLTNCATRVCRACWK